MKKFLTYLIDEKPLFTALVVLGLLAMNTWMCISTYKVPIHYNVDTFYDGEPATVSYHTLVNPAVIHEWQSKEWQLKIVRIQTPTKKIIMRSDSLDETRYTIVIFSNKDEVLRKRSAMDNEELAEFKKFTL